MNWQEPELSMSCGLYFTDNRLGRGIIALYGNEETKKEVLPKLASGNGRGICATSRAGGSDVAAIKTQGHQER